MTPLDLATLREDAEADVTAPSNPEAAARVVELATEMVELRDRKADLQERLKDVNQRYDELRKDLIPECLYEAGMVTPNGKASLTLSDGAKLHLTSDLHVSLRKADRPEFFEVLRDEGDEAMIQEVVHYGSMRAWVRERMADGREVPEVLKVATFLKAVARGGGNRA